MGGPREAAAVLHGKRLLDLLAGGLLAALDRPKI